MDQFEQQVIQTRLRLVFSTCLLVYIYNSEEEHLLVFELLLQTLERFHLLISKYRQTRVKKTQTCLVL